jgi:secretion/DNA translocation related TadE-like protein
LALTVGTAYVGSAVIARHRAQSAADLAALAAADGLSGGVEAACERATSVAAAVHVAVTACTVDGLDVVVTVEAAMALTAWGSGPARAAARAGPAAVDGQP